jgi:hypothetical protein
MKRWEKIRMERMDMTDYVVHLTRVVANLGNGRKEVPGAFAILKLIIKSGYLIASYAPRVTRHNNVHDTVKRPHKAVCFTEQPLEQLLVTLKNVFPVTGYDGYGIALHKTDLSRYGGRHAIYGDEALLAALDNDFKYLWVRYRPMKPGWDDPVDFTPEREWRSRVAGKEGMPWKHELPGVPLLLPFDFYQTVEQIPAPPGRLHFKTCAPDFRIIVKRDIEVEQVCKFISGLIAEPTAQAYYHYYYSAVKKAQIISLEHVERRLEQGDEKYRRIETLPMPAKRRRIIPLFPRIKSGLI